MADYVLRVLDYDIVRYGTIIETPRTFDVEPACSGSTTLRPALPGTRLVPAVTRH